MTQVPGTLAGVGGAGRWGIAVVEVPGTWPGGTVRGGGGRYG
jgi:hypothetical protein